MKTLIGATVVALAMSQVALSSEYSKVNGSISIAAGETVSSASTVNGSIEVGERARVGSVRTVNGAVTLAAGATVAEVNTVNGAFEAGSGAQVSGNVRAVNGKLHLGAGAVIGGNLTNVNGTIELEKSRIKGKITTVNGDLTVGAGAQVDGGILYKKPGMSWGPSGRAPRVIIGPDAVVGATLVFERTVELFVSESAKIGPVTGVTPVRFKGASPPG
jgi:predicted acyltransferase (DUF342 family)